MSRNIEKSLLDVDFASLTRGPFTPSPAAWEDQVLYFLMLDRFSDGNENGCASANPCTRSLSARPHAWPLMHSRIQWNVRTRSWRCMRS